MRNVILDANRLGDHLQEGLREAFSFPDYYGMNLDALHDCLTEICEETQIFLLNWEDAASGGETEHAEIAGSEIPCNGTEDKISHKNLSAIRHGILNVLEDAARENQLLHIYYAEDLLKEKIYNDN